MRAPRAASERSLAGTGVGRENLENPRVVDENVQVLLFTVGGLATHDEVLSNNGQWTGTYPMNSCAAVRTEYRSDKSNEITWIASDTLLSSSAACLPLSGSRLVMYTLALRASKTCSGACMMHVT